MSLDLERQISYTGSVEKRLPIAAVIVDKDLTITEDAALSDKSAIYLENYTLFESRNIKPIPETIGFLWEAKAAGLRIGLLTNDVRGATEEALLRLGLEDLFDAVVANCKEREFVKPEAGAFIYIASLLGTPPENCLMIGDDLRSDIRGALRAGMKTALVPCRTHVSRSSREGIVPDIMLLNRRAINYNMLRDL